MAGMLAGHQRAARRRAYGIAGIMAGEAYAFGGHAVQARRLDLLLAETAQIAVSQIVGQDEDNVWLAFWIGGKKTASQRRCGARGGTLQQFTSADQ